MDYLYGNLTLAAGSGCSCHEEPDREEHHCHCHEEGHDGEAHHCCRQEKIIIIPIGGLRKFFR